MSAPILLEISDALATVTFNRPERRNAVTFAFWYSATPQHLPKNQDHSTNKNSP
jgi:enoyl-CoA hydratase/carnithine racemase